MGDLLELPSWNSPVELPSWTVEVHKTPAAPLGSDWVQKALQPPPPKAAPKDVDQLARTIWGEARGEPPAGQAAVGSTIMNRLKSGRWGSDISSVVHAPNQFESWDKGFKVDEQSPGFQELLRLAQRLVAGQERDPTGGAMYFHTQRAPAGREQSWPPKWAKKLRAAGQIGAHQFYKE